MFELKITGIYEASRYIENGWPTHVISLVDPGVTPPQGCGNHLTLHMHDIETQIAPEWVMPTVQDLDAILAFGEGLGDGDRLLVHCHQGISRSTAAAIAILIQHGMTAEGAYRYAESIRDILMPNGFITRATDAHFGLSDELIDLVMEERKIKMQHRLANINGTSDQSDLIAIKAILERLNRIE